MSRQIELNKSNTKILGRHLFENNTLWLTSSAAGVHFNITASRLSFCLEGDITARTEADGKPAGNCTRLCLFINGQLISTTCITEKEQKLEVFSGSEQRSVLISLIKITESSQSYVGIKNIEVSDDAVISPAKEKSLKLEFIGDSITCGYGVETRSVEEPFSTLTENAAKAYAYLAAQKLDADYLMSAYSSFGLHSGWTDNGDWNNFSLVPRIYDNVCFSWNTKVFEERKWDFSLYTPDIVIINLGTNDMSYCTGHEDSEKKCNDFIQTYIEFLKRLRKIYPDAKFVLSVGIMKMGNVMWRYVDDACTMYKKITGDTKAFALHFNPQTEDEGFGSGFHPTEKTQMRCADELVSFIKDKVL